MKDAAIKLIETYTSSFEGITEKRCYDEGVDHERCTALRRHFERDTYGATDSIMVEGMLLYRSGWSDEATHEIVFDSGKDAVFKRGEWLADNMQPRWYRFDFGEGKRRMMLDELLSMRPVEFDHSIAEKECDCGPPNVKASDPIPQRVIDEYHRDLVDIVLHSTNQVFSTLAALQLGKITEEDRKTLIPVLESRNAFRRELASSILINDALRSLGTEEAGKLMAPILQFYMDETDPILLLMASLYVEKLANSPSSVEHISTSDQDAVLNVLGKAMGKDEQPKRIDAIQILGAILPSLGHEQRETAAQFLLTATNDTDTATSVRAMKTLARIRPLAEKSFTMLGEKTLTQIDGVLTDALINGSEGMRRAIAFELSSDDGTAIGETIKDALEDASSSDVVPEVRSNAMRALANYGALTEDIASRGLRDEERYVRRSTIKSIAAMGNTDEAFALKTLERCLGDRDPDIRAEALLALWSFDDETIGKHQLRFRVILEKHLMKAIANSNKLSDPSLIHRLTDLRDQLSCEGRLSDTM